MSINSQDNREELPAVDMSLLGEVEAKRVAELAGRYPDTKSAVMPALYIAQEKLGWLPEEAFVWVGQQLSLSAAHVRGVASFYTMYYKRPVGAYHVQVCRTLSCMLCGARGLTAHLKKRLGIEAGQISTDGLWSFEEVECLGSCGTAPMIEINDVFFENLTAESLDALMDRIEQEKPELRYSTVRAELGGGLSDRSRSRVWK